MNYPPEGAPVADEIMTMGEVSRTLARLDRRIEAGMAGLSDQLTLMRGEFIHRSEYQAACKVHDEKQTEMERAHDDYERRLRIIEATPTVSPKTLWFTVASIIAATATLFGAFSPVLEHFYAG